MADSDNTTSLPVVTRTDDVAHPVSNVSSGLLVALTKAVTCEPAAELALKWMKAHAETQALCIRQQELDKLLSEQCDKLRDNDDLRRNHAAALRAENLAAISEQEFLDSLPEIPAQTMGGVIGKLTMILGELEDNTDATDFPGPHISSVLDDLKRIAGQAVGSAGACAVAAPGPMK